MAPVTNSARSDTSSIPSQNNESTRKPAPTGSESLAANVAASTSPRKRSAVARTDATEPNPERMRSASDASPRAANVRSVRFPESTLISAIKHGAHDAQLSDDDFAKHPDESVREAASTRLKALIQSIDINGGEDFFSGKAQKVLNTTKVDKLGNHPDAGVRQEASAKLLELIGEGTFDGLWADYASPLTYDQFADHPDPAVRNAAENRLLTEVIPKAELWYDGIFDDAYNEHPSERVRDAVVDHVIREVTTEPLLDDDLGKPKFLEHPVARVREAVVNHLQDMAIEDLAYIERCDSKGNYDSLVSPRYFKHPDATVRERVARKVTSAVSEGKLDEHVIGTYHLRGEPTLFESTDRDLVQAAVDRFTLRVTGGNHDAVKIGGHALAARNQAQTDPIPDLRERASEIFNDSLIEADSVNWFSQHHPNQVCKELATNRLVQLVQTGQRDEWPGLPVLSNHPDSRVKDAVDLRLSEKPALSKPVFPENKYDSGNVPRRIVARGVDLLNREV